MATTKRRAAGTKKVSAKSGVRQAARVGRNASSASTKVRRGSSGAGGGPRRAAGVSRSSASLGNGKAGAMRPSISFISLLVRDVAAARRFYEGMGLAASDRSREDFALFQMNGVVLAIATRTAIRKELGFPLGRGGGMLLSHNVHSEAAVADTIEKARRGGAKILRRPSPASWGGMIGCFADPDGHVWEVVFNPQLPMDAAGNALLDPPGVW